MVDFRKCLLAFAAAALYVGTAGTASAQTNLPFSCTANAGVPPLVRVEGITELVGDVLIQCTGGTPTAVGAAVPAVNIQIFLNTNITSRILSDPWTEALLLIDEPGATGASTQLICGASGTTIDPATGSCPVLGTSDPATTYSGAAGRPNIFQARTVTGNPASLAWLGVPIDPPGSNATRTIRLTNIRANASGLPLSSTLIPTQITMFISVSPNNALPISNPQQTVAIVQAGLTTSIRNAAGDATTGISLNQCVTLNSGLAAGSSTTAAAATPLQFQVRVQEGFGTAFKLRTAPPTTTTLASVNPNAGAPLSGQNVPGFIFNAESGFYGGTTPVASVAGAAFPTGNFANGTFTSISGRGNLAQAGLADFSTRLRVQFNNVNTGVSVFVPSAVILVRDTDGAPTGVLRLVTTDASGNGAFSAAGGSASLSGTPLAVTAPLVPVTITANAGVAVYEVVFTDPSSIERANIPVTLAYTANTGQNLPALGQSTVNVSFAPISNVTTASSSAPIPRFVDTSTARNTFAINACVCNLLFPFVTNQAGFDTGIAISNTSQDIFGTSPQSGAVRISYFGSTTGGGAAPAAQTSGTVPAGSQLLFTLSSGGNLGVTATPGFQGYIIAQASFQFCHGFAFISDLGAQRLAEGYLGLVLDAGTITRGSTLGESLSN